MFSQDSFEGEGDLFVSYDDEDVNVTSLVPMDALQSGISVRQVPNVALGEAALAVRAHRSAIFVASCTIPPTFTPSLARIAEVSNSEIASSTHSLKSSKRVYHRRVPSRKDFDSEQDYIDGCEAWRSLRDRNNKAVRKSRGLTDEPTIRRMHSAAYVAA